MLWRVRLFDGPLLESSSGQEVRRFRSRKVGALLAYLALHLGRQCAREELALAIWPETDDPLIVANRLRVTLASLRRQLEPTGVPFGSVLDASVPGLISLRAEAVSCDVREFEIAVQSGLMDVASNLVQGELLPGFYDDWAVLERHRLDALVEQLPSRRLPEPAITASSTRSSFPLPLYLTRFFGRELELEHLTALLKANRLVTITGPGGTGKTRLAVQTAHQLDSATLFVALADVNGGDDVAAAILNSLHVSPSVGADLADQLISFLVNRGPLRLILDNAEQVVEGVAQICLRLLGSVPELSILVTSRQRLDVAGEALLPLAPLATPDPHVSFNDLPDSPAVALFIDRARNARPDFVFAPRHREAMLRICALLEGMPLALELAAARIIAQTPSTIQRTLEEGLTDLASRQRGLSPRHQSLRASIQGSFDLLSVELQAFFGCLSAFRGGWTLEAAQAVTGCASAEEFLEELVTRSLVMPREEDGTIRYYFLESIRQFASETLDEGIVADLSERHRVYFLELAARASEDDILSLRTLDREQDNLILSLKEGANQQDEIFLDGLAGALTYGHVRGLHRTFLPWAEYGFTAVSASPDVATRTRLLSACYYVVSYLGMIDLILAIGEALRSEGLTHKYQPALVLGELVLAYRESLLENHEASRTKILEALDRARQTGDKSLIWKSLRIAGFVLCNAASQQSDVDRTIALAKDSEELLRECLAMLPANSSHITFTRMTLSYALDKLGRRREAYRQLKLAQCTAVEHGMRSMLIFALRSEFLFALSIGNAEYAAQLYGAFLENMEFTGYNAYDERTSSDASAVELIEQLGKVRADKLVAVGRRKPIAEFTGFSLTFP